MERIKDFKSFYEFYLTQHSHPICRLLHVIGTFMAVSWVVMMTLQAHYSLIPFFLVWGYGLSWVGHFLFEKNIPAAFKQPFYSFRSDLQMCFEVLTFQRGLKE